MGATHHGHAHPHPRHNVRREESPTNTDALQSEYRIELNRRFSALRGALRTTIDANDALQLRGRENAADDIDPRDRFEFQRQATKAAAFQQQLVEWLQQGILEPVASTAVSGGTHWTATYVDGSYRAGLRWANTQLRDSGDPVTDGIEAVFDRGIHQRQLRDLYTRNFTTLRDITDDVDETLSRVLARGLAEGKNPRTIADELTAEVRDIQRRRARTLARTEVLKSHNAAAGRRFQEYGIDEVVVLTHDPCPVCERIEANDPYPVSEAHAIVPDRSHPQCVCTIAPKI